LKILLFTVMGLSLAGSAFCEDRKSGYDFMTKETREMQDDDTANPAMLWVLDGEALWKRKAGAADKACADCHAAGMKGVAARYPALHRGTPVTLETRINACRTEHQQAEPFAYESRELLALASYIGQQSRGMPIAISADPKTRAFIDKGRELFARKQGQINLSCRQCHEDNPGKHLAGSVIPQAHPTGYPIYRLEWQGVGSLERRLRNCLIGMRAEPYDFGAPELVNLELFLLWRARGMKLETPAVRP
jgi:sulfur-oxidizing protein SoxA